MATRAHDMKWVPLDRFRGSTKKFYRMMQPNLYDEDFSAAPTMREQWAMAAMVALLALYPYAIFVGLN